MSRKSMQSISVSENKGQNKNQFLSFVISPEIIAQIDAIATESGRSRSDLCRSIISDYISNFSKSDSTNSNVTRVAIYDDKGRILDYQNIENKYLNFRQTVMSESEYVQLKKTLQNN